MRSRASDSIGIIPEDKRGGAGRNPGPKLSKIKCRVCSKRIPVIAAREGDPFCSSDCCQKHYGVRSGRPPATVRLCSGCGRNTKDLKYTPGCKSCKRRRYTR